MLEYIYLALVSFGIGLVTGVALVLTIIVKAMKGAGKIFKPPTLRGP